MWGVDAAGMWFLRGVLGVGYEGHTASEGFWLGRTLRGLVGTIKKERVQFLGHCMRKDRKEKLAVTGKIAGRRVGGIQGVTFLQSIAELSRMSAIELIQCTGGRNDWHKLIADVIR